MGAIIKQIKKSKPKPEIGKGQPSLQEKLKEAFLKGYSKGFKQGASDQRALDIENTVKMLEGLEEIPGIGEKTAWKIREHVMKSFGGDGNGKINDRSLVDKLEDNMEAECVYSPIKDWVGSKVIAKKFSWQWMFGDKNEEFYLSNSVKECKWRIIPKYVNFGEAMEAYKSGKTVRCDYISAIDPDMKCSKLFNINKRDYEGDISWHLIVNGKWSIEK